MSAILRLLQPDSDDVLCEPSACYPLVHELPGLLTLPVDARAFQVLASYEQAGAMIDQDYLGGDGDSEWAAFFVESMVEFLVWSHAPAGRLTEADIAWLEAQIARGVSPSLPALLFALVRELNEVPERLTVLALRYSGNRRAALH